jgi:hypothetical protein
LKVRVRVEMAVALAAGILGILEGNGIFATSDGVNWAVLPATKTPEFTYVNRIAVAASGVMLTATNSGRLHLATVAAGRNPLGSARPAALRSGVCRAMSQ